MTAAELGVVYLSVVRESGEALPLYGFAVVSELRRVNEGKRIQKVVWGFTEKAYHTLAT